MTVRLWIISLLLCVAPLLGQTTTDSRLYIVNFDEGEFFENVQELRGNVHLRQEDMNLFCQQATWYRKQGRLILKENVRILDSQKELSADHLIFYENERREEAQGNVRVVDSTMVLSAERLVYFEDGDYGIADKGVRMVNTRNNLVLTGGHAEYYRAADSVVVTFNPVLIQMDSLGAEAWRITGQIMELRRNGDLAMVVDSVRIIRDDFEVSCGQATYWRDEGRILLEKHPRVWRQYDHLSGEKIELFLDKKHLKQARVNGRAKLVARADSADTEERFNLLDGNDLIINFENNQMRQVTIEHQATSWYHIFENKRYQGLNKVTGDKICIWLAGGQISRIRIESDPGSSSGVFYPPGREPVIEKTANE
ncbi:hypothetical protein KAH55_13765 [bacterium]|nr:hypothetical protein [bacterium]